MTGSKFLMNVRFQIGHGEAEIDLDKMIVTQLSGEKFARVMTEQGACLAVLKLDREETATMAAFTNVARKINAPLAASGLSDQSVYDAYKKACPALEDEDLKLASTGDWRGITLSTRDYQTTASFAAATRGAGSRLKNGGPKA